MLSFYSMSPSGFDIEYGWAGLEVDDDNCHVVTHAPILLGVIVSNVRHDR